MMKTVHFWLMEQQISQASRKASPETESHVRGHMIYGKLCIQSSKGKDDLFHKCCWGNLKLQWGWGGLGGGVSLSGNAKINSREIRDLCEKQNNKASERYRREYCYDVRGRERFLTPNKASTRHYKKSLVSWPTLQLRRSFIWFTQRAQWQSKHVGK